MLLRVCLLDTRSEAENPNGRANILEFFVSLPCPEIDCRQVCSKIDFRKVRLPVAYKGIDIAACNWNEVC